MYPKETFEVLYTAVTQTAIGEALKMLARETLLPVLSSLVLIFSWSTAYSDPIEGDHLDDKAIYLCTWRHHHPENPTALLYCDGGSEPDYMHKVHMQDWWQWMFNHYTGDAVPMRRSFLGDWTEERVPVLAQQQRRDAQERAARKARQEKAEADAIASRVQLMSVEELCVAVHSSQAAKDELLKRNALTPNEWSMIGAKKIGIGMSEAALICSWGHAPVNRTVTAAVTRKQYVYSTTFVYVEGGKVVAFQDHQ